MPGPNAFPRETRLTQRREYDAVFRRGRRLVGPIFVCYVTRCEGTDARLGLAVSRKVGGAVVRNRVKRHVREFFRTHRARLPRGTQVVVVARPAAARCRAYAHSAAALQRLFEDGGLLDG